MNPKGDSTKQALCSINAKSEANERRQLNNLVDTLSESQKTCLRLVAQGMTSKEIAQSTGLAPQTVDTYLKVAMHRLDASTRREAARKLVHSELPHKLGSPPASVATTETDCDDTGADRKRNWAQLVSPPALGGAVNELNPAQRTYAVLKVAAIALAVVFALTLFVTGLLDTFR